MPDIIKKTPGNTSFKGRDRFVVLRQGVNQVSPSDWDLAKKLPGIVKLLDKGDLVIGGEPPANTKADEPKADEPKAEGAADETKAAKSDEKPKGTNKRVPREG